MSMVMTSKKARCSSSNAILSEDMLNWAISCSANEASSKALRVRPTTDILLLFCKKNYYYYLFRLMCCFFKMSVRNPHRPSAVLPNVSTSHATLMDDQTKADIVQPKHDEESAYFYLAGNPDCLWQELSLSSDGFIQPITPKLPPHLPQARERYTIMDKYGHKMKRLIWGFRLLVVPFWFGLLIAALTLASIDAVRYGKRNPAAPDIPPVLVHSFIGGVMTQATII